MSARYWELESSADNWALEDGTGARLLEDATTTTVSNTFTHRYDIIAFVSKIFTYLYDITATILRTLTYIYDINDTGSDVLQEEKGTLTSTILNTLNNEICFVTKTDGPRHYSIYIFLDNMQSGDAITVKFQIKDPVSDTWKSYKNAKTIKYGDIKSDVAAFHIFLPARAFRVCLKQTTGTLRSYNWAVYKSK
ncbi:MAG: hypothetical protein AB1299_09515, partial [Thermoproteota archaeon]